MKDRLREVAEELMTDATRHRYGYELSQSSGVRPGRLYPILTRLVTAGWLEDGWEDEGSPRRRYYVVTAHGRAAMKQMLEMV